MTRVGDASAETRNPSASEPPRTSSLLFPSSSSFLSLSLKSSLFLFLYPTTDPDISLTMASNPRVIVVGGGCKLPRIPTTERLADNHSVWPQCRPHRLLEWWQRAGSG